MSLQSNTTIKIDGTEYPNFLSLHISQAVNDHHTFEVSLLWDQFAEDGKAIIEKSQEFIGTELMVLIKDIDPESTLPSGIFKGIITGVETVKSEFSNQGDNIRVKGFSPTILMDDGPHCIGYEEKDLIDIVRMATSEYDEACNPTINPITKDVFPYIVQYQKSTFGFLKQLAVRFGEWFYYDGEKIVFGSDSSEQVNLKYGVDLISMNLNLETQPKIFNYITRDYYNDEKLEEPIAEGTELQGYHLTMAEKSETLFARETIVDYHRHTADGDLNKALRNAVVKQGEGKVAQMVVLAGSSSNPAVKVGGLISINHKTMDRETSYGNFIVTKVTHTCHMAGEYKNTFEAIPESVVYPGYTDVNTFPKCETQTAMVVDNADPQGLGRIKVEFSWQKTAPSPWIRMSQPHSGADKGFHFIPEVGEEVMVGFEGGNAEKPFVMGALFHGTAKPESFTTDNNDVKAIRTRSGHTIELNDTDGEEKINIYDKEGTIISFNTAEKSLIISAPENIDISAKNVNISAEENITIGARADIEVGAEGDLNQQAQGKLALQSAGDTTMASDGGVTIEATTDAIMNGQNVTIEGKVEAALVGVQTSVEGKMTAIQGTSGKVELM